MDESYERLDSTLELLAVKVAVRAADWALSTPSMSIALEVSRAEQWVFLCLDKSGSMSGARLEAAKQGAIKILETLQDGDMLCIFTFNQGVQQVVETVEINGLSKIALLLAIASIEAGEVVDLGLSC